jgi:hypothetical protein
MAPPTVVFVRFAVTTLLLTALATCGGGPASNANVLASAPDYSAPAAIDNIPCETMERIVYHVHAHLAVYVDGQPRVVPEGIGIASPRQLQNSSEGPFVVSGGCFYWLHTHTADGVIHVEAPIPMDFRLGQFSDIWQQPLSPEQVGPAKGSVVVYLNGQLYRGNPRDIPLAAHNMIQLDVGHDVPPRPFTFPPGL